MTIPAGICTHPGNRGSENPRLCCLFYLRTDKDSKDSSIMVAAQVVQHSASNAEDIDHQCYSSEEHSKERDDQVAKAIHPPIASGRFTGAVQTPLTSKSQHRDPRRKSGAHRGPYIYMVVPAVACSNNAHCTLRLRSNREAGGGSSNRGGEGCYLHDIQMIYQESRRPGFPGMFMCLSLRLSATTFSVGPCPCKDSCRSFMVCLLNSEHY